MWDLATIPISPSPQTRVAPDRCEGSRPGEPHCNSSGHLVAPLRADGDLPHRPAGRSQLFDDDDPRGGPGLKTIEHHLTTFALNPGSGPQDQKTPSREHPGQRPGQDATGGGLRTRGAMSWLTSPRHEGPNSSEEGGEWPDLEVKQGGGSRGEILCTAGNGGAAAGEAGHGPMQCGEAPEGGEERGWAYVPASDRTDPMEVDFKDLSVAGRTACGGWGYCPPKL